MYARVLKRFIIKTISFTPHPTLSLWERVCDRITPMSQIFFILMVLAALSVAGVLIIGIISMAKGGEFNKKYGNKLMQARVVLQGFALVLFVAAFLTSSK